MTSDVRLLLVGIGTGAPEHLTLEAVAALRDADLVMIPRKGAAKDDLAALRRTICATHRGSDRLTVEFDMPVRDDASGYLDGVERWHDAIADVWRGVLAEHLPDGGTAALLVWGDPALYDSSSRIAHRLTSGVTTDGSPDVSASVTVVPAPSSLQVLAAAHAISLHGVGEPFLVTTGRRLREEGWPSGISSVAVMLDGECSFSHLTPDGIHIWWGAYLGMGDRQLLVSGELAEVASHIVAVRAEARRRHGWIMDVYLIRRT